VNQLSQETLNCMEAALRCHSVCYGMAMIQGLEEGGKQTRPQHFRLMMDCAILCQTVADLLAHKSQFHHQLCAICAEACEACATDCESIPGLGDCVMACRDCAEACWAMS
jgi:hypothetical protein